MLVKHSKRTGVSVGCNRHRTNRRWPAEWEVKIRTRRGSLLFGFDFLVGNFVGFGLPRSRPRDLHGQTGAFLNLVLKQAGFGVETSVSDLAAIVSTPAELLVPVVVAHPAAILHA